MQPEQPDIKKAKIVGRLTGGVTGTDPHPENKRDATTHIDAKRTRSIVASPRSSTFPHSPSNSTNTVPRMLPPHREAFWEPASAPKNRGTVDSLTAKPQVEVLPAQPSRQPAS
jgi:hypothetical protein